MYLLGYSRSYLQQADFHCVTWDLLLWYADFVVVAHGLSCSEVCRIVVPWPGIEPTSPALQGGFLTTEPPGKSPRKHFLKTFLLHCSSQPFVLGNNNNLENQIASNNFNYIKLSTKEMTEQPKQTKKLKCQPHSESQICETAIYFSRGNYVYEKMLNIICQQETEN